jgi:DDE superfamily endonuclease
MTKPQPCPAAPGPLEAFAVRFDDLFSHVAQRRGFRAYLQGLLLPRDRNKTLTALVGAEPIVQAQDAAVQQLQWFLSEASWDTEALNRRRLALLCADPATPPTADGVLIIDDSGDRKAGTKTAHVARQYLGSVGKIDNGIVAVTSVWADAQRYYPLHLCPYTPASRLPKGKSDPDFKTKPQLARDLVEQARKAGIPFCAVVADSFYGDNLEFEEALHATELAYVLAMKPTKGHWAPADALHTPQEAAAALRWQNAAEPGDWTPVVRRFRDGHVEMWWAADLVFAHYGPEHARRLVVVTTDPRTLPAVSTWYLVTNLPLPGSARARATLLPTADLAEITRLYGLRNWVEQSYKQQKDELGWADFMVRTDRAIRRHWQLVVCAFTFCWQQASPSLPAPTGAPSTVTEQEQPSATAPTALGGKATGRGHHRTSGDRAHQRLVAQRAARCAELVGPVVAAPTHLVRLDNNAAAR